MWCYRRGRAALFVLFFVGNTGCYDSDDFGPTAPAFQAALTLDSANGQDSLPADGVSRLELVAQISQDASQSRRTIVFSTTAGELLGTAQSDGSVNVLADTFGRATIQLQSPQQVGTAQVSASVLGVEGLLSRLAIRFTESNPSEVIRFVGAPRFGPADNASTTSFEVKISPSLPLGSSVEFSTTIGTFLPEGGARVTRTADGSFNAYAELKSPASIGSGRVTAKVNNVSIETGIQFVRALPDTITVSTGGTLQVVVNAGAAVTVTGTFLRDVGSVTDGTIATFRANDTTGADLGFFRDITVVNSSDQASASFVPGTTIYRGRVTLTVGAEGSSSTGSTEIELVDPPP